MVMQLFATMSRVTSAKRGYTFGDQESLQYELSDEQDQAMETQANRNSDSEREDSDSELDSESEKEDSD